ncbi:MAG: class I SAM-dependent methyltransferase [Magnetococcus sp. YQC-5]
MQKLYTSKEAEHLDKEQESLENYWTNIWDQQALINDIKHTILNRDEFKFIDPFLQRLVPNAKILDGGCGMGEWTLYYTQQGFDVIGLDTSQKTLDRLTEKFPTVPFRHGDIRKTDFADNHFDAILSWGVFEHFEPGLSPCLQEAYRILKPGGLLCFTVPYQNLRHTLRVLSSKSRSRLTIQVELPHKDYLFYSWRFTQHELKEECWFNGFKMHTIQPIHQYTGIKRILQKDLGIKNTSTLYKPAIKILKFILPDFYTSHMLLGIGFKT